MFRYSRICFQNKPLVWHKEDPEDDDKGLNGLERQIGEIQDGLYSGKGKDLGLVKHDLLVRGGGASWYSRQFWWLLGRADSHQYSEISNAVQNCFLCRISSWTEKSGSSRGHQI
jgi:hypothetical protein